MIAYSKISIYDMKFDLESVPPENIKVIDNLEPDAVRKVRIKSTGEVVDLPMADLNGFLHNVFIDGTEFHVLNCMTRLDDPDRPLPSSQKIEGRKEKKK